MLGELFRAKRPCPVLEATRRTSGWLRWGILHYMTPFCGVPPACRTPVSCNSPRLVARGLHLRGRTEPWMASFPPIGGDDAAT